MLGSARSIVYSRGNVRKYPYLSLILGLGKLKNSLICLSLEASRSQKVSLFTVYSACSAARVRSFILGVGSESTLMYRLFCGFVGGWGAENSFICLSLEASKGQEVPLFIVYSASNVRNIQ